jgi:phosphomannomutase
VKFQKNKKLQAKIMLSMSPHQKQYSSYKIYDWLGKQFLVKIVIE